MKILITGGMGFVGSNIANILNDKYDITVVDDLSFGSKKNLKRDVFKLVIDFNDLSQEFLDQFDVLVHCATANINFAITKPIETFKINALNTINLFSRFKGKIVYTSTSSVYGSSKTLPTKESEPKNVYNAYDQSKLIAEQYLQLRGNYTTLRLSNVYGKNQRPENTYAGVVGKFLFQAMKRIPITVYGDGKATRDYTYVDDVVKAVDLCIEQDAKNKEYNVSGYNEFSTNALVKEIVDAVGEPYNVEHLKNRPIDKISRRLLDSTLIKEDMGWEAEVDLKDGLKKTYKWVKKEYTTTS